MAILERRACDFGEFHILIGPHEAAPGALHLGCLRGFWAEWYLVGPLRLMGGLKPVRGGMCQARESSPGRSPSITPPPGVRGKLVHGEAFWPLAGAPPL